jgi:hypothetical protein
LEINSVYGYKKRKYFTPTSLGRMIGLIGRRRQLIFAGIWRSRSLAEVLNN